MGFDDGRGLLSASLCLRWSISVLRRLMEFSIGASWRARRSAL